MSSYPLSAGKKKPDPSTPLPHDLNQQVKHLEELLDQNSQILLSFQDELHQTKKALAKLQTQFLELYKKSVTTCVECHTEFDLLTHHYSIGLYDNLVFVKCPKCNKGMAIDRVDGLKRE